MSALKIAPTNAVRMYTIIILSAFRLLLIQCQLRFQSLVAAKLLHQY